MTKVRNNTDTNKFSRFAVADVSYYREYAEYLLRKKLPAFPKLKVRNAKRLHTNYLDTTSPTSLQFIILHSIRLETLACYTNKYCLATTPASRLNHTILRKLVTGVCKTPIIVGTILCEIHVAFISYLSNISTYELATTSSLTRDVYRRSLTCGNYLKSWFMM